MSVLSFVRRHKNGTLAAAAVCAALLVMYIIYNLYLAPTKIALVNFPAYQVSNIALANDSRRIRLEEADPGKASDLKNKDVILLFGPGLRLTPRQAECIEKAGANGAMVYAFVFSTNSVNTYRVDSLQRKKLDAYYTNRSRVNYRNMLRYIRETFDGRKWGRTPAEEPEIIPSDIFIHLEDGRFFQTAGELTRYLKEKGLYRENAPRIAFLSGMTSPLEGNREYIDSLITGLMRAGFNVYPMASAARRQELLESVRPDAVVYLPMGRLGGDKTVEWLQKNNIPLFCPLSVMQERDEWLDDNGKGVTGGYLTARIVLPEIDGGIDPLVISTQNKQENGYYKFDPEPERVENFISNIKNYLSLRQKDNKDKKIAVCYFKGAGQSSLLAAGLEVVPSLFEFLKRLKREGYTVSGLPATLDEFNRLLQRQGPILGGYAKGAQAEFMKNGDPLWISARQYDRWAKEVLHPDKYAEVVARYGEAPGAYLSGIHQGEPSLAVACLPFGNVVLFPQPRAAEGDNGFRIVHGADVAPPHAYIAPYLWVRKGFGADAIIHFGTHGSLEFTPGKQAGLSRKDWPDCLVGALPHFYYYSIANVGEGIIAKRKTHAVLLSCLTPPFMESRTRGQYASLFKALESYFAASTPGEQEQRSLAVKETVMRLGMCRELDLDTLPGKSYSAGEIEKIENFAEEIANEKMTGTLYTLGKKYDPAELESTVVAMCADPLAYSMARLDQLKGKISRRELESNAFVSKNYLQPAKNRVKEILRQGKTDVAKVLEELAVTPQDRMRAMATEAVINPRQLSMSEMMAMAGEGPEEGAAGGKPGKMTGETFAGNETGMKMPAGIPKIGKMPDWVKKRIEAKQKAGKEGKKEEIPEIPAEEKEFSFAVLEIERTVKNIINYRDLLAGSPEEEMSAFLRALSGGYIAPSPGGDAVLNPNTLPTGRNMYSINAEATPGVRAWDNGKALAEATLRQYYKKHGEYPRKVSYTFWAGEFIESEGATFAQALYMLGVEPVRDGMNRVTDLRLIPSGELGRPRVDIVCQTSGQLRDLAASRLQMLTRAVSMAASSANDSYPNYVAEGCVLSEKSLVEKGMSPKDARELSRMRIFGAANGGYGTGITSLVEKGDAWEDESEIASAYLNNMGAMYGTQERFGEYVKDLFAVMLQRTDVVVQPRQSNTWGALSLDHMYEFMGGLNLSVRNVTGEDPDAYLSDYRNRHRVRIQELSEAVGVESRSTLLNPEYVKEKMKGGASSAETFAETFRNTYGWNVMKPSAVDNRLWNDLYNMYVQDVHKLGVRQFFEKESPAALEEITAVMLETARKGYWKADARQLQELAALHTELIRKFDPACSGFVCDNVKLQGFIGEHLDKVKGEDYNRRIGRIKEKPVENKSAGEEVVLEKERMAGTIERETTALNGLWIGGIVLLLFAGAVIMLKRKNRR